MFVGRVEKGRGRSIFFSTCWVGTHKHSTKCRRGKAEIKEKEMHEIIWNSAVCCFAGR